MKIVRRLGSQFMAFLSGAILATGLAILTGTMLTEQRPADVELLLAGGLLVCLGGVVSGWISVISGDVEALETHESDPVEKDAVWEAERHRLRGLLLVGVAITLAGVAMLPVRLSLIGWHRGRAVTCSTLVSAAARHPTRQRASCVSGATR